MLQIADGITELPTELLNRKLEMIGENKLLLEVVCRRKLQWLGQQEFGSQTLQSGHVLALQHVGDAKN